MTDRHPIPVDNATMPTFRALRTATLLFVVANLLTPSSVQGQTTPSPAGSPPGLFPDGSRTVWIGDSITHACLYTRFLEDYARSRYPDRQLIFVNAGVSADTTADVLLRFDQDVRPWNPTRVFVCLGMNDGAFRSYDPDLFKLYQDSTRSLLDRIRGIGADTRVLSPTPVSSRSQFRKTHKMAQIPDDYPLVLARMRDWLEGEAKRRKLAYTDLMTPLQEKQELLRLENPGANLIPDGVHPNAAGHALMALQILSGAKEVIPRWTLRFPRKGEAIVQGGSLEDYERDADGIRFRLRAHSLPWVLPAEAMAAAHIDTNYRRINSCVIQIVGLREGIYELRVDGSRMRRHTGRQWARGVDIGLQGNHPDWLQSLRITEENALRSSYIYKGITDLWIARHKVHDITTNGKNGTVGAKETRREVGAEVAKITDKIIKLAKRMATSDAYLARIRNPLIRSYEIRRLR